MVHKISSLLLAFLLLWGCSNQKPTKKSIAQTIPLTMGNLRGHQSLYNEGWFVISSSKKALNFAQKHGVVNAKKALDEAIKSIADDSKQYVKDLADDLASGVNTTQSIFTKGTQRSKDILIQTQKTVEKQIDYAKENFSKAWELLIKGNISFLQRTKEEREALMNLPVTQFKKLKRDFSNLSEIASSVTLLGSKKLSTLWEDAFNEAQKSFIKSYEDSGESENTLGGLFHIIYGYLKAIYHGVASPTVETVGKTAYHGTKSMAKLIYLPIGATISVVGRSVESLGLTLYYVTSTGVKFVSPTVEAGFLSALSFLSLGSTGVTYVAGGSLGVINQVGTTAIAPVAGVGEAVGKSVVDTAKVVTFVSFDIIKGSSKIIINEAASGVVLGYNALTALPTHMLLAASDGVFFLAWDGPRLVIAAAKGEVGSHNINTLPVGTVLDLKKLQEEKNIELKVISKDYKVIEKVLHKLSDDMKVK